MSTSVDTMKNFFNVLKLYANDTTANGVAVLDHAVRTVSHFAGLQDAVNHFVYDIAGTTAATAMIPSTTMPLHTMPATAVARLLQSAAAKATTSLIPMLRT